IVIPVIMMIYFPLGKLLTKFSIETQNKLGVFTDFGSFISKENAFIKVNLTHELERKKGIDIIDSLRSISKKQAKIFAIITPIVSMLLIFSILSVIAYGLYLVNVGSLSLGSLVAYLTLFFQIINPISNLGKSFSEIKGIAGATFRIRNLLNIRDKEQLDFGKNELKINSLKFTDVSFSYESTEIKAAKTEVLKNINFSALSGSLTAFVGPSGSGKTTIFSLIERMYTNYDGKILLNNLSLEDIPLSNSREKMGYVMQNYPVFQGTVKDNLLYGLGSEISEEKILEISAVTNFKTVIDDLPQGLDTVLLENGNSLSEGQKQRLAITRCLLADFDLLLLDEVTSSLDAFSEKIIQETIDFYVKEKQKVVLVNAHRLSTIRKADQIIFLDKGIITGIGTHEDLIKTHGLYKEFIEMQF
ncbi:ABC transporter ATP-binding protein, partial [Enterococcus wangshanyuanii]